MAAPMHAGERGVPDVPNPEQLCSRGVLALLVLWHQCSRWRGVAMIEGCARAQLFQHMPWRPPWPRPDAVIGCHRVQEERLHHRQAPAAQPLSHRPLPCPAPSCPAQRSRRSRHSRARGWQRRREEPGKRSGMCRSSASWPGCCPPICVRPPLTRPRPCWSCAGRRAVRDAWLVSFWCPSCVRGRACWPVRCVPAPREASTGQPGVPVQGCGCARQQCTAAASASERTCYRSCDPPCCRRRRLSGQRRGGAGGAGAAGGAAGTKPGRAV